MTPDDLAMPAFVLSIIGLVVAGVAAATSIASLVWQIIMRTRGAHRVSVRGNARMRFLDVIDGVHEETYVEVRASNSGLTAVEIQSWYILLADGTAVVRNPANNSFPPQRLPHALQPGSSVSFYMARSELLRHTPRAQLERARAGVILGTGARVLGRRGQLTIDS
jgi:hypothetical protein